MKLKFLSVVKIEVIEIDLDQIKKIVTHDNSIGCTVFMLDGTIHHVQESKDEILP